MLAVLQVLLDEVVRDLFLGVVCTTSLVAHPALHLFHGQTCLHCQLFLLFICPVKVSHFGFTPLVRNFAGLGDYGLKSRHVFLDSLKFDWTLVSIDGQCIEATDSSVGHPLFYLLTRQSGELHQLVYFIIGRVWGLDVVLVPTVQYLV